MANHVTHRPARLALAAAVVSLASAVCSQDQAPSWPQWRGPDLDGISKETKWRPDGDAEIRWSKQVGLGYSTVSIAGGRLYTVGHDKDEQKDTVYCLDSTTGDEVWTYAFSANTMAKYHGGGTLATPSVDGKLLFVSQRQGRILCLDAAKGKVKWEKNVVEAYGAKMPTWGFAASPLVLPDMIVCNYGRVIAFDRKGKVKWKSKDSGAAYSTPAYFEHKGKPRLAVFNGDGLVILDKKNGKEIVRSAWKTSYNVNAATPVVMDNKIFISSGYNKGCSLLEFDGKKLKPLWANREMRNKMSGSVAYGQHLYGVDEGGSVKCLDLDGNTKWSQRFGLGAMSMAGDKLLILTNRGELVIAAANPEEYKELSRAKVLKRHGVDWTVPVLCGGLIYCRSSAGQLVCVDRRLDVKKG